MKVLVLTQYFWPETFRINEVVRSLQDIGCEVSVLTGQPNYPGGVVPPGYSLTALCTQMYNGLKIHRVPIMPRKGGSASWLILNYLSFIVSAAVFGPLLLRNQRIDVIFVYAPSPVLQAIPAVWLAWLKRARLITWVQDLWPQSLEETGYVRNQRLLAMVTVVVRWIYRHCDLLLVQSRAFITPVQTMAIKTPVEYHPNPGELAYGQAQSHGLPALTLEPGFNVVFAGNLGKVQALETVLDAAELLQDQADVRITLLGSGSRSEWLLQEVVRRQLVNVQLAGRFAPESMPDIFAQASALLVCLVRSPIMSKTVPSKIQAYLAAGKPIIGSLDGEGARVLEESGAGVLCPAEDAVALAEAVLRLRAMPSDALLHMGETGKIYYRQHFDPDILAAKLMQHFARVLAEFKPKK